LTDIRKLTCALLLAISPPALTDVAYVINGVDETLKANVLGHVDTLQFGPQIRPSGRNYDDVVANAITNARAALRPFGYYAPEITSRVIPRDDDLTVVELTIDAGPPVRIRSLDARVEGPGSEERDFIAWRRAWTLSEGAVLNQLEWADKKQEALEIAHARGYLGAEFTAHKIEIDLEENTANVRLVVDTGPRYVMGDIDFGDHVLKPGILEYIPRFEKGDAYTTELVNRLRTDLWKTGYFDDVQVSEVEQPELDPPAVDFNVQVDTETRNHYTGAIGFGSGTGFRLQANWSRHPVSSNGERIDLGIGYQEHDNEFTLRGRYRRPRRNHARQWWDTPLTLKFENLDLEVRRDPEDEETITIASGDLQERHLRFGRLRLTNLKGGESQLFDNLFVQYLNSDRKFQPISVVDGAASLNADPVFNSRLHADEHFFSVGADIEIIDVQGRRFDTIGHRDVAWLFHSNTAFGSDAGFTQLYLSTRRSYRTGDRLKFHVRAEVGYTDADVEEFALDIGDDPLNLSITSLPNFYRFKAGGSMSVRGYGFERLSNNDIGSNHIITGSVETEVRFLDAWSGAAFFDIGNAFNDWNDPDLKRGVGVGIRWYSIAGEIRVDVAKALDYNGKPWRLHITIGTPLL